MLVLSRKTGERLKLGDSIVVTILELSRGKVRIGIQAPPNVVVLRDELEPVLSDDEPIKLRAAA